MKLTFDECTIIVEGGKVNIIRGKNGVIIPLPFSKYTVSYEIVEKETRLRDFDSQFMCDKIGEIKKLRKHMFIRVKNDNKEYSVIIVKDDDKYFTFYGWSWFDGDKYGYISVGAI